MLYDGLKNVIFRNETWQKARLQKITRATETFEQRGSWVNDEVSKYVDDNGIVQMKSNGDDAQSLIRDSLYGSSNLKTSLS